MKNAIIGALSGYSIVTLSFWEVRDNLWAVAFLSAIIVWSFADYLDEKYEKWRKCHEGGSIKSGISRLQRRKSKKTRI